MKIPIIIFVLFIFLFSLTSRGGYDGYELENFLTTRNIVLNHSAAMEPGHNRLPGVVDTDDGQNHYTRHGLAQPILEIPFFILGHTFSGKVSSPKVESSISNISSLDPAELLAVSLFNITASAILVLLIYLTALDLYKRKSFAVAAGLLAGFTSLIWPYSAIGLEPLLTISFFAGFYFLLHYKLKGGLTNLVLAGLSIAILVNSKNYGIYLSLPLIFYAFANYKRLNWERVFLFFSPIAVGLFVFGWYNELRFGSLIEITKEIKVISASSIIPAFVAFTASFGKGFFIYSPTLVLALFSLKHFYQKFRTEALVWLTAFALVVSTLFQFWFLPGDEMWGPRYLVLFIPILAILSAPKLFELIRSKLGLVFVITLIGLSIWIQLVGLSFFGSDPLKVASQAGAKTVDEILYVPEYSPVYVGSLMLVSEIKKIFTGEPMYWSKIHQFGWSSANQEPTSGPEITLSREGGLVMLLFRVFNKAPVLAMAVLVIGLTASFITSFLMLKSVLKV